ncbi:universal stress protein [Streptomyces sp. NPDC005805]|uniref:universal stress protein n=1 Tax=Streptomyces sp. NPDC005805 TaxID=3157068 RepID=UPI0033DBC31D
MRRTITTGVDGSPESVAAADWAAREALRRGYALTLLHAGYVPDTGHHPATAGDGADRIPAGVARDLRAAHPGLEVDPRTVMGPPVDVLLAAAGESELLVLGSQGFSGFAGFLIGSASLDVTARSPVPVVLVRGGRPPGGPPRETVLLGLDLDSADDELIGFAFEAAAVRGAPLEVLHAWQPPPLYGYARAWTALPEPRLLAEDEQTALTAVLRPWREKYPEVPLTRRTVQGRAAGELVRAAGDAGLLVVGRRAGAGDRLGPVVHAVVHHAPCPIAVVPHGTAPGADRTRADAAGDA